MNSRINSLVLLTIFVLLSLTRIAGQTSIGELFPDRRVLAEVVFPHNLLQRDQINATKRYVSIFVNRTPKARYSDVFLYDAAGNLLWQKQLNGVRKILMGDNSGKIIVLHNIDRYMVKGVNTCFDERGNKLWEIDVLVPGIETLSSDGKYGITLTSSEENGRFRLFDLESGMELKTPIPQGSHGFTADFIDSENVAVLIQNVNVSRDTLALMRGLELKSQPKPQDKELSRDIQIPNTWIYKYHPVILFVYHIPTQTILTKRELFAPDGAPLLLDMEGKAHIAVSPNRESLAIALYRFLQPPNKKRRLTIVGSDLEGTVHWENIDLAGMNIEGLFHLGETGILVNERGAAYHLLDQSSGNTLWRYTGQGKESNIIRQIFTRNGVLVLYTSYYGWGSTLHYIDPASGMAIRNQEDLGEILVFQNQTTAMVYDKGQKRLQFLKQEE